MKKNVPVIISENTVVYEAFDGYTSESRIACLEHEAIYWHRNCGVVETYLFTGETKTRIYYIKDDDEFEIFKRFYKSFGNADFTYYNKEFFCPKFPCYIGVEETMNEFGNKRFQLANQEEFYVKLYQAMALVKAFDPSYESKCELQTASA